MIAHRGRGGRLCGSAPQLLRPDEERRVRALWREGATQAEIAMAIGIPIDRFRSRLRDQLADLPRRGRGAGGARHGIVPSRLEIDAATAEIRSRWPEDRWLGRDPHP